MINARNIGDGWYQAVRFCVAAGHIYTVQRGSYEGQRRLQLPRLSLFIGLPGELPMAITWQGKALSSRDGIQQYYENYIISDEVRPNEQYTYGRRIVPWLPSIVEMLIGTPGTNQACLSVAKPGDVQLTDPPCLRSLAWNVVEGKLQMTSYWRSWDLYTGLPMNLAGLQLLNQYISGFVGLPAGPQWAISNGLHLYEYCWPEFIDEQEEGAEWIPSC